MDAIEYVKARNRICTSNHVCVGCALYDAHGRRCKDAPDYSRPEDAVESVELWMKNNPGKTRQSEFLKMFSDAALDGWGVIKILPCDINKNLYNSDNCEHKYCIDCRREYWLQEVDE